MRKAATSHKFKVGQTLKYLPRRLSEGVSYCKILRQLPYEDGEPLYRIKCSNENVERVVKEFSLSRQS
jgi:hypothetical protein